MHIDCHKVKILHHWSANGGHLLSSAVLVEFTLHDHAFQKQPLRSRLVEYVCLPIDPGDPEIVNTGKLEPQACEQIRCYFNGDGRRENLFTDGSDPASDNDTDYVLSPADEAELQAELRLIEQDVEYTATPAPETLPRRETRQPAPA